MPVKAKTLFAFILVSVSPTFAIASLPDEVGDFSDPDRLVFKGDCPFPASEIRQAVAADLQLQILGTPSYSLRTYLRAVPVRLQEGFRAAGFSDPVVETTADAETGNINVNLKLGRRWKCSRVIVRGAPTAADAESLLRAVQQEFRPPFETTLDDKEISVSSNPPPALVSGDDDSDALKWTPGEHAPFDSLSALSWTTAVRQQLARLGYLHPFLHVSIDPGTTDANLNVKLIDEGQRVTLHEMKFDGLNRYTPKQVTDFLGTVPGEPVNLDRMFELQKKLWESGRFLRDKITIEQIDGDREHVNLRISLQEADGVPPLGEPLSEIDQAKMRFRQWCVTALGGSNDIAANLPAADTRLGEFVFNGARGFAMRLKPFLDDDPRVRTPDFSDISFLFADTVAGIYLPHAGLKWESAFDESRFRGLVRMDANDDANAAAKKPLTLSFNWKLETSSEGHAGKMVTNSWFAPVAFLLNHPGAEPTRIKDGVLLIPQKSAMIRADAATGRLIDVIPAGKDGDHAAPLVVIRPGALDAMKKALQAIAPDTKSDTEHPFASFLSFAISAACHIRPESSDGQNTRLARALHKAITDKWLYDAGHHFESLFTSAETDGADQFAIPLDPASTEPQNSAALAASFVLQFNSRFFTPHAWPATFLRCICLMLTGHGDLVNLALDRLIHDDTPARSPAWRLPRRCKR